MHQEEDKIQGAIHQFMESILLENDVDKAMAVISDNIIGIGMGEQSTVLGSQGLRQSLGTIMPPSPRPYKIAYPKETIHYHPPAFATASIVYEVLTNTNGNTVRSAFMQTVAAQKEDGQWKLCLVQAVPLVITGEYAQNYPLKFTDTALAELKSNLQQETFNMMNDNFAGGILGIYMTKNYPLYFANDNLIALTGYTHAEFYDAYSENATEIIFIDDKGRILSEMADYIQRDVDDYELQFRLNTKAGGAVWVIEHARKTSDANGVPILLAIITDITQMMGLQEQLKAQNETALASLRYASKIQRNLLPAEQVFQEAFWDYSVIWKPKDLVGGDIYWLKNFPLGTVLGVCDCTGHGTPGALLTMLVTSTLDAAVQEHNYQDPAQIMVELDQRMSDVLNAQTALPEKDCSSLTHIHDGCDLAILFIAKDGQVTLSSSGVPLLICDGHQVERIKGQRLQIGEGKLRDKTSIKAVTIPRNPDHKFYLASDGLYDQIGGESPHPFGYGVFNELILKNHHEKQAVITQIIWAAFEEHRGQHLQRDDVELITFKL